jgi:hypothetical protein
VHLVGFHYKNWPLLLRRSRYGPTNNTQPVCCCFWKLGNVFYRFPSLKEFFFSFYRGVIKTARLSACNDTDVSNVSFSPYPDTQCHIPEDGGTPSNIIGPTSSETRLRYPLYHVQCRAEIDTLSDIVFYANFSSALLT